MTRSLAYFALLVLAGPASAQDLPIVGTVVGAAGSPVAGAEIVLVCPESISGRLEHVIVAEAVTGAAGRFALDLPGEWLEARGRHRQLEGFVLAEGHELFVVSWGLHELPAGHGVTFTLTPLGDPGPGPVGVTVVGDAMPTPVRVFPTQVALGTENRTVTVPDAAWQRWAVAADQNGAVRLPVRRERIRAIGMTGEGIGQQIVQLAEETEPIEVAVFKTVERRLVFGGERPVGALVHVESWSRQALESGDMNAQPFRSSIVVTGDETQTVPCLSSYVMARLETEDASALRLGFDAPASGDSEPDAPLVFPRSDSTIRVIGRVVSDLGDTPVVGAAVTLASIHTGCVVTGADGRFEAEITAAVPTVGVRTVDAGADYYCSPYIGWSGEAAKGETAIDLGDLVLQRCWTARGSVNDPDGRPAPGVLVVAEMAVPAAQPGVTFREHATTVSAADGSFVLRGLIGVSPRIVAKSGSLAARGALRQGGGPISLQLASGLAAAGEVLARDGQPVAGLELRVFSATREGVFGGESHVPLGGAESFATDADGRFRSPGGLERGKRYCLLWGGDAATPGQSDWYSAEELSEGVSLVVNALRSVRGVLTGRGARPLAGATLTVRSTGEWTITDESGVFGLSRVSAAGEVVLVTLPRGRRSWGVLVPGAEPLAWTLRPVPVSTGVEVGDPAAEREIARGLLAERLDGLIAEGDDALTLRAVRRYAWADPAGAMERVERGLFDVSWRRDFSLAYVYDALVQTSPEEALSVAHRIDPGMSQALKILDAGKRLGADAELEQLALLRAKARAIDPPEHRLVVLARLGSRLLDLGLSGPASEVLDEAREVAETLPNEEWPAYARSVFGEILSRIDRDAGRALIDSMAEQENVPRHLGNTAVLLAASDPAAAEELMAEVADFRGPWRVERYAPRIAYAMAPVDLERARRIAARYDSSGYADGLVALALLDRGGPLDEALASLERAFELVEAGAGRASLRGESGVAVAASLLPVAARADPAELEYWIARALALPRPAAQRSYGGNDGGWTADAALAWHLHALHPGLARALVEPAVDAMRGRDAYSDVEIVWAAAAAVDPEWAARRARGSGETAVDVVGQVLAMPREARARHVQADILQLWLPGGRE